MNRNSAGLYLSVITVAEVQARRLADWLDTLLHLYGSRILSVDVATARQVGALADRARGLGLDPGLADLVIGATATVGATRD